MTVKNQWLGTRLDVRVNELYPLILEAAEKDGLTVADWLRLAIAEKLGVASPHLARGNPAFQMQGKNKKSKKD